jgi:hypothetical protein
MTAEPSCYVLLDFAMSPDIKTPVARANRLLTACDKYVRNNPDTKHLTVFVSEALATAGDALAAMTDPANITVQVHKRFTELKAGVQGEMG